nr:MAG TPA: hypothetical protein [Caudoviricetes sp.]
MYSVYEIICLDRGSTPLTSTVPLPSAISLLDGSFLYVLTPLGQLGHVVKLPTRACLVLTDRGDKYIKHYTIN